MSHTSNSPSDPNGFPSAPMLPASPMGPGAPMGSAQPAQFVYARPAWMRPHVGMAEALNLWWKNLFVLNGRASRSEYWWMILWLVILNFALNMIANVVGFAVTAGSLDSDLASGSASPNTGSLVVSLIAGLAQLIISLSFIPLEVRRLHDVNKSGWWVLAVQLVGLLPLIAMAAMLPSFMTAVQSEEPDFSGMAGPFAFFLASLGISGVLSTIILIFTILGSKAEGLRFDRGDKALPFPQTVPASIDGGHGYAAHSPSGFSGYGQP